ncbi:MAG: hypothetical protein JJE09_00455 [Bacteroidia bacterium]|nr:hypothetical protein [Bacteroidia bacterium]
MNRLLIFICLVSIFGCKDTDPNPTSLESKWSYTTPDLKMTVTFESVRISDDVFDIKNQTMTIDGVMANAEKEVVGFTSTTIEKIRINANDSKVVYSYNIEFKNATISSDFKMISVPFATYTFPWGTSNTLTNIVIERL